jgi:hypothetical protein
MACTISRPDPQSLFNHYRDMFSANVLGGAPVVPESNEWYVTALNYAMAEEFYAISEQQWKERDPRYACCENLYALAAADGVYPRPATAAQGYVILTGTSGASMPGRIEVTAANGRNYASVSTLPKKFPSSGTLTVRVQDISPGADGNASGISTAGTLSTAIAGVNRDVVVCGGSFCGGADAETCEEFRTRYIARKQYQPRANQAWAIAKIAEWPCVTRVIARGGNCCNCAEECSNSCAECGSALDFYVMMDNSFACGVPPQSALDEIQAWFFGATPGYGEGEAEIGVCGRIVRPNPFLVNVYVDIVGCPTASQTSAIQEQVADLFATLSPSTDIKTRQVELIASNVIGPTIDVSARFEMVNPDPAVAQPTDCGDLLVSCDYIPCLNQLFFTGPGPANGGAC